MNYLLVLFVSFCCILLELFWTKILNLKAWNHVVYTVIPFAILGYGIGANIHLLLNRTFTPQASRRMLGACLWVLAVLTTAGTYTLIRLPLNISYILNIFADLRAAAAFVALFIMALVNAGTPLLNVAVGLPFVARVVLVAALLAPAGIFLGVFFPGV